MRRLVVLAVTVVTASIVAASSGPTPFGDPEPVVDAGGIAPYDWLSTANAYRSMSGLPPVGWNRAWDGGTRSHSCYMLANGIAHDEIPGRPGYTSDGDAAGNASNVAMSGGAVTPQDFVEMWMTAPYHAIGLLRPGWRQTSYGECREPGTATNRAAGTLDVIRGTDWNVRNSSPILFPGRGATIRLTRFIAEWPDPLAACGWAAPAGLPLIAMMPNRVSSARATLTSPDGGNPVCVLHAGNAGHPVASSILDGANAVVIVPRRPLADGQHSVQLQTSAGNVDWRFSVRKGGDLLMGGGVTRPTPTTTTQPVVLKNASFGSSSSTYQPISPVRRVDTRIPRGTSRLRAGRVRKVRVASSKVRAVSANVTVVNAAESGYLAVYDCRGGTPNTATVNFPAGRAIANLTQVGLKSGRLCLKASTDLDVVIDVTGQYFDSADYTRFHPVKPRRIMDTRSSSTPTLRPRQQVKVSIPAGLIPEDAKAAVVNLAAVNPSGNGWINAYPCSTSSTTANLNFKRGDTIANSTVVPLRGREFCVTSNVRTDLVIDVTGYYDMEAAALRFKPTTPIRMFDSRSTDRRLNSLTGGKKVSGTVRLRVAGMRGIPAKSRVINLNVAGASPDRGVYVTAYSCDKGDSGTSTLNLTPQRGAAAGAAMVEVSGAGFICLKSSAPTHVIVDVTGVWIP